MPATNTAKPRFLLFIVITFAFSWLLWIPAALSGAPSSELPTAPLFALGGFGPSIAGLFLLYRFHPPAERRDFWRRLVHFKAVRPGWYALMLLIFPLLTAIAALLNSLLGGSPPGMGQWNMAAAQPVMFLPLVLSALFLGPFSEELGWRGYALDPLLERWGTLRAALPLGLIWWAWHLPLFLIVGTTHHAWGIGTGFFWLFLAGIFPLSLIITLAYRANRRSILAAVLLHMMYNLTLSLVFPLSLTMMSLLTVMLYLAAAWLYWVVEVRKISHLRVARSGR